MFKLLLCQCVQSGENTVGIALLCDGSSWEHISAAPSYWASGASWQKFTSDAKEQLLLCRPLLGLHTCPHT